jgi:hypothetical protein
MARTLGIAAVLAVLVAALAVSARAGSHERIVVTRGARYADGDGWTATHLVSPRRRTSFAVSAVYMLELTVSHQSVSVADGLRTNLVVDCRSGLLRRWVGPDTKMPPAS